MEALAIILAGLLIWFLLKWSPWRAYRIPRPDTTEWVDYPVAPPAPLPPLDEGMVSHFNLIDAHLNGQMSTRKKCKFTWKGDPLAENQM